MAQDFELSQKYSLNLIWAEIRTVETNIQYSSLLADKKKKTRNRGYMIIFGVFLLMPALKNICVNQGWLSAKSTISWSIDIIYAVAAVLIPISIPEFVMRYLGFYEKDISDLHELNARLDLYKDKLFRIFSKAESCTTKASLDRINNDFDKIKAEHKLDITKHDELTGDIIIELQTKAQKKAYCILEQIFNP